MSYKAQVPDPLALATNGVYKRMGHSSHSHRCWDLPRSYDARTSEVPHTGLGKRLRMIGHSHLKRRDNITPPSSTNGKPFVLLTRMLSNTMELPRSHRRGMLIASWRLKKCYSFLMASGANSLTMIAIWAHMRFSASSNTLLFGESIISSVTSSPLCAGRQCRKM